MKEEEITGLFRSIGLKATPQRVAVYKYLCENPVHPDADEIYKEVVAENPNFSKTTVYNALEILDKKSLITKIRIDTERVRYDADTSRHGHFICEDCNNIYDFNVEDILYSGLENFNISGSDIYLYGRCPECK